MEINLKIIDTKVEYYAGQGKPAWAYLSKEEREIYAAYLVRKKHFLSAARFTTNEDQKAELLERHKKVCIL